MRLRWNAVPGWAIAAVLLLAACGQQTTTPVTPPSPTPPGPTPVLILDPFQKRFTVSNLQTGSAVRLAVEARNTDTTNGYGSLRLALALQASGLAGGLGQQDVAVLSAAGLACDLQPVSPVASPSDYPGGWAVEYDIDPAGGPTFAIAANGSRGPVCVEVVLLRPGVAADAGVALEGVFFVYGDSDPPNGRYDLDEPLRSRPLFEPMDIALRRLDLRL